MSKLTLSALLLWVAGCMTSPTSDSHPTPDDPDPDLFDDFVPDSGGAGNDPIASRFVFPVRGRSVTDITQNTRDPRSDGWKVNNDFGTYCADCGGNVGLHPGEDWNLRCPQGEACDLGEPVYAAAPGRVVYRKYLSDGILWGVVVRHVLPEPTRLDGYVLPGTTIPANSRDGVTVVYTAYLHMKSIDVQLDQLVSLGDRIGAIGSANGPHLHFEMRFPDGTPPRLNFPLYQNSAQAMTNRGMISPTRFVAAHALAPSPPPPPPTAGVRVGNITSTGGQFVCASAVGYPNRQATSVGGGNYEASFALPFLPFNVDTIFWLSRTPTCTDWSRDFWPSTNPYSVNGTPVNRCVPRPDNPAWRYVRATVQPNGAVLNAGTLGCPS